MKPYWLVLVIACSGDREEPRKQPPRAEARHSIDLRVSDAPLSIRGVELAPSGHSSSALELGYRVEAQDRTLQVPARIMCHVGGYNVVYPSGGEAKPSGPRLAALYRPDPFTERPQVCEVDFFLGERQIAAACYRDGTLGDGECARGTFPAPSRAAGFAFSVELTRASLELRSGTALVSGLFTKFEPLAPNRRYATQIRCEDSAGSATGEGELAFLPLDSIPAGASVYGPVAMFLDRTTEPTATCELRIVSRAVDGAPTEQIHGRYCMTTGAIRAGACP